MTSEVKSREQLFLHLHPLSLEPLEEPEPVMTTVDHAASRGLMTTFLASVGCLPHARGERTLRSLHAAEGSTTPGLCLFQWRGKLLQLQ
jgi:hypothetical protein